MIWIDYGFARPEYYHPARSSGTLRTFSQHRAGEDPLDRPGESDITAHVDFTAIAECSIALGGRPLVFQNQGNWLTHAGRDWLLEQEGNPKNPLLRQFQTLTHPAHLGGRFHVLEISWNPDIQPPDPPSLQHRLFGVGE
jgi:SAM-dependent MidA family methyltransferase